MCPPAALLERGTTAAVGDFDADVVLAFGHQNLDRRRFDRPVQLNHGTHRILEKFEANVVQVGRHVPHFNIVPIFVF